MPFTSDPIAPAIELHCSYIILVLLSHHFHVLSAPGSPDPTNSARRCQSTRSSLWRPIIDTANGLSPRGWQIVAIHERRQKFSLYRLPDRMNRTTQNIVVCCQRSTKRLDEARTHSIPGTMVGRHLAMLYLYYYVITDRLNWNG